LHNPYICQRQCATNCVRDVPGLLHTHHTIGIIAVGCLQIATCPLCKSQERGGCSAPKVFLLRQKFKRLARIFHGVGDIAHGQGLSGTVHRDHIG
jgi:hypothetical protein